MNDINYVFNNPDQEIIENMARNYKGSTTIDKINDNLSKINYFSSQGNYINKSKPKSLDLSETNLDSFIISDSESDNCDKILSHVHKCKKCKQLLELISDSKKIKHKKKKSKSIFNNLEIKDIIIIILIGIILFILISLICAIMRKV